MNDTSEQRLKHPDFLAAVADLIDTAGRLDITVAVACVCEETQEISAFGMCCPDHLVELLHTTADAVEELNSGIDRCSIPGLQ